MHVSSTSALTWNVHIMKAKKQVTKQNVQVLFQASVSVRFIPVQLVKENYMNEPRVSVGEAIK